MAFPYQPGDVGERSLTTLLAEFRLEVREYFGAMNELRMGLKPEKPPIKPGALSLLELCQSQGLPLVAGGLVDQPYIWLLQCDILQQEIELQRAVQRNTAPANQTG